MYEYNKLIQLMSNMKCGQNAQNQPHEIIPMSGRPSKNRKKDSLSLLRRSLKRLQKEKKDEIFRLQEFWTSQEKMSNFGKMCFNIFILMIFTLFSCAVVFNIMFVEK